MFGLVSEHMDRVLLTANVSGDGSGFSGSGHGSAWPVVEDGRIGARLLLRWSEVPKRFARAESKLLLLDVQRKVGSHPPEITELDPVQLVPLEIVCERARP